MNLHSAARKKVQSLRTRLKAVVSTAILDAAEEVFAKDGINASMETIAARAGVAVGTLYNHFADRQSLLYALADAHTSEVMRRVELVAANKTGPFREVLRDVLRQVVDATSPAQLQLRILFIQAVGFKRAELVSLKPRLTALLEDLLARGRKAGLVKSDPHHLQPLMLMSMLMGALHMVNDEGRAIGTELAEVVTDAFLNGVAVKEKSR